MPELVLYFEMSPYRVDVYGEITTAEKGQLPLFQNLSPVLNSSLKNTPVALFSLLNVPAPGVSHHRRDEYAPAMKLRCVSGEVE